MKERDVLALIELAYRGVEDPRAFQALLDQLTTVSGMEVVGISAMGRDEDAFATQISAGTEDPFVREYIEHIAWVDPFTEHAADLPCGLICFAGEELVPRRELRQTEFFDWMHRMSTSDLLIVAEKTEERGFLSLAGFTSKGVEVQESHLQLWSTLGPHVFRAVALSRQFARLEAGQRVGQEALSMADFGCAYLDAHGCVEWMNAYAEALLETDDGLRLDDDRRLRAVDRGSDAELADVVMAALRQASGQVTIARSILEIRRPGGRRPIEVLVSPIRPSGPAPFRSRVGALVIFADPEHVDEGFAQRLQRLYPLTPAEAEIAQWLLSGVSVNEIAEIFGKSVHTIRTHLKSVLRKCGVSSQAELVGTLQRGLARLA